MHDPDRVSTRHLASGRRHGAEERLYRRWYTWFVEAALPFWRDAGWVKGSTLALERLRLDGRPDHDEPLRVRTQARQIYTFTHATQLGLLTDGVEFVRPNLELEHFPVRLRISGVGDVVCAFVRHELIEQSADDVLERFDRSCLGFAE